MQKRNCTNKMSNNWNMKNNSCLLKEKHLLNKDKKNLISKDNWIQKNSLKSKNKNSKNYNNNPIIKI